RLSRALLTPNKTQTLVAQLVFIAVQSPHHNPSLHHLISATIELYLRIRCVHRVFIFVVYSWLASSPPQGGASVVTLRRPPCTFVVSLGSP
ncbi:hypothetical protein PIB30_059896, partial [Stylosanthes scabra]|nr:hypothetical protein [Stylosanthes scabra]